MNMPNLGNIDFSALAQGKQMWDAFQQRHPNFPKFLKYIAGKEMPAGTKITINVEYPSGQNVNSTLNLKDEDVAIFKNLSNFL